GRCTLWKSHTVGEIFTEGLIDIPGRAPCPTTFEIFMHQMAYSGYSLIQSQENKKSHEYL
ncbi:MAG: hypothetical protein K8R25_13720, partial [Methanosarcinales archaeon]|nr:hypothetical protein [Methanosarcinales archaeon]